MESYFLLRLQKESRVMNYPLTVTGASIMLICSTRKEEIEQKKSAQINGHKNGLSP